MIATYHLFNPLNLPTKNYNPIKTMVETNTMDKFFRIIHSSNGTPGVYSTNRDIRINKTEGSLTIAQMFEAHDINTFETDGKSSLNLPSLSFIK
mgnify:CR=1 FL=1